MFDVRIPQHKKWEFIHVIGYSHYDLLPELSRWIYDHNIILKWELEVDITKSFFDVPFTITGVMFHFENSKDALMFKLIKG